MNASSIHELVSTTAYSSRLRRRGVVNDEDEGKDEDDASGAFAAELGGGALAVEAVQATEERAAAEATPWEVACCFFRPERDRFPPVVAASLKDRGTLVFAPGPFASSDSSFSVPLVSHDRGFGRCLDWKLCHA